MSSLRPRRHRGDKLSMVVTSQVFGGFEFNVWCNRAKIEPEVIYGKWSVQASKQTYTRKVQWNHASVGLAQARPNYLGSTNSCLNGTVTNTYGFSAPVTAARCSSAIRSLSSRYSRCKVAFQVQQDVSTINALSLAIWASGRHYLASYPGLLAPVFVTCSTNVGGGLVKLSHVQWHT